MVEEPHSDDMLSEEEEKILDTIEKWMNRDIKAMISGGCNVSCATLLSIFMEVLGGIAEGTLMRGKPKGHFEAFLRLKWFPKEYRSLSNELTRKGGKSKSLYKLFRCSLIHAYFFGGLDVINDPKKPTSRCSPINVPGIKEANDGSGRLIIHVNDLAYDIKKARDLLFKEIREKDNRHRANFRMVITTIKVQ